MTGFLLYPEKIGPESSVLKLKSFLRFNKMTKVFSFLAIVYIYMARTRKGRAKKRVSRKRYRGGAEPRLLQLASGLLDDISRNHDAKYQTASNIPMQFGPKIRVRYDSVDDDDPGASRETFLGIVDEKDCGKSTLTPEDAKKIFDEKTEFVIPVFSETRPKAGFSMSRSQASNRMDQVIKLFTNYGNACMLIHTELGNENHQNQPLKSVFANSGMSTLVNNINEWIQGGSGTLGEIVIAAQEGQYTPLPAARPRVNAMTGGRSRKRRGRSTRKKPRRSRSNRKRRKR